MDINSNYSSSYASGSHFSPYTASGYPSVEGKGDSLTSTAAAGRRLLSTDSILEIPKQIRDVDYSEKDKKILFRWRLLRGVSLGILGLSSFFFLLLILQPLLVFLFTLGGCEEWFEFASEVLIMSMIPGGIGILSAIFYLFCQRQVGKFQI